MSNKRFLQGTLILTGTGLLTRFIGFFYRIFLSHSIGAQGMGIFQLVMPLQTLAMALCSSGIQMAISHFCASRLAVGQDRKARDYFVLGAGLAVSFSVLIAFLMHRHAAFLAWEILKEPRTLVLIRLTAFGFPLGTLHSCVASYYFSQKKTALPACVQLLEQLTRVGATYLLYLILLSEGREVTPVIAAGGSLASELAASLASLLAIGINFQKSGFRMRKIQVPFQAARDLVQMALPHSLNRILVTLLGSMEVILIPQRLVLAGLSSSDALSIYGVFSGMALPLILFPSAITNSASAMLMPSVAQLQALGCQKRIRYVTERTCCLCLLLGSGCTMLFFFFGKYLGLLLFKSATAGSYIRALAFICPFLYLNTALTSILNGLGRTFTCLLHNVAGILVRIAFVLAAIPVMEIRGYFYGMLLGELIRTLLHLAALRRLVGGRQQAL